MIFGYTSCYEPMIQRFDSFCLNQKSCELYTLIKVGGLDLITSLFISKKRKELGK